MALRDQPYLPLYVQDLMTDEKLMECSASATGIYLRLMCLMHKSEEYGKVLLKQKGKQNDEVCLSKKLSKVEEFALKVSKFMPYSFEEILAGFHELLEQEVIYIEENALCQKRMIKDNRVSIKRSQSGKIGGEKTKNNLEKVIAKPKKNTPDFAQAKTQANSENANEVINEIKEEDKGGMGEKEEKKILTAEEISEPELTFLVPLMLVKWKKFKPKYADQKERDFKPLQDIACLIAEQEKLSYNPRDDTMKECVLKRWGEISEYVSAHDFYKKFSLLQVNTHLQGILEAIESSKHEKNSRNNHTGGEKNNGSKHLTSADRRAIALRENFEQTNPG